MDNWHGSFLYIEILKKKHVFYSYVPWRNENQIRFQIVQLGFANPLVAWRDWRKAVLFEGKLIEADSKREITRGKSEKIQ